MSEEMKDMMVEGAEAASTEEVAGVQGEQVQKQGDVETEQKPEKKYTDADVDRIIARKIAAERQRMSKLFNEEQQESELEKRERNVLMRELKADAKDALVAQGLPYTLANLMDYGSKEDFEASYKEVTEVFKVALERALKDVLKGESPRKGYMQSGDAAFRNAFAPKAR